MPRDPRYDSLFEPVRIGPVTTRNRFYQVPHCNGMGFRDVSGMARMRGIKAEGGWGVVCTEQCEFHWSSESTPLVQVRLFDDRDAPALSKMAAEVHAHGSLAGVELVYPSLSQPSHLARTAPFAPTSLPVASVERDPVQGRAMDLDDIRELRRWHRLAARRAKACGFDIVYVYAAHALGLPFFFLSRRFNHRTDEYGGSLRNRSRLLRELIEETKDEIGDTCGIACRISIDEVMGPGGIHRQEFYELMGLIGELPDLWDVTLSDWSNDSQTARFAGEAAEEKYVAPIKKLTSKPVVGVGRFTSPDTMLRQVNKGVLDLIGAARPSIADPFLPRKIEEGRLDDIRECIGCNMCAASDALAAPIRCTQNPTIGEEWRRGWHPERIEAKGSDARVLVVGAGAAGLECARALGERGYEVVLAEAGRDLGGRVTRESRLPGLSAWARVRDWRLQQLQKLPNVDIYRESRLDAEQVLAFGARHVMIATGAGWRRDGIARHHLAPIPIEAGATVLTPDDVMEGKRPAGDTIVYDDDYFYMGGLMAELLAGEGRKVHLIVTSGMVSWWTRHTLEDARIHRRLLELGIEIHLHKAVDSITRDHVRIACVHTGRSSEIETSGVVLVTAREPQDRLVHDLRSRRAGWADAGLSTVRAIGDTYAPGTIAAAVHSGHLAARELDGPERDTSLPPFRREMIAIED